MTLTFMEMVGSRRRVIEGHFRPQHICLRNSFLATLPVIVSHIWTGMAFNR